MVYRVWYQDEGLGQYGYQSRDALFACDGALLVDDRRNKMDTKEEMRGGHHASPQTIDAGLDFTKRWHFLTISGWTRVVCRRGPVVRGCKTA